MPKDFEPGPNCPYRPICQGIGGCWLLQMVDNAQRQLDQIKQGKMPGADINIAEADLERTKQNATCGHENLTNI